MNTEYLEKDYIPVRRTKEIVAQELPNETLLYDLRENKAICLNHTATLIWKLCDGNNSVADLNYIARSHTKTDISEELIWLALDQLKRSNLLEIGVNQRIPIEDISRREVFRMVGYTSMIALPAISTIVAPTSAQAQSCIAFQSSCNTNSECCSGNCQSGTNPDGCCVPGATDNRAPGLQNTGLACGADPAACNALPQTSICCSGAATTSNQTAGCSQPNTFRCQCAPFS